MKLPAPLLLAATLALPAFAAAPELVWETDGFNSPESIVYDAQRDVFYVSNMATRGEGQTMGDGFISRVSPAGEILDLNWVGGLDNPKGLAVANDRLYVGDDNFMAEIDLGTGTLVAKHAPTEGRASFNDCTADPLGNVYVFSSPQRTVFRLHAGKFEPWVAVDTAVTGGRNGLRAETDRLLLGGWSRRDAAGNEILGHVSAVSFVDKSLTRLGSEPVAHVDGLEPDGFGGYTVTDWLTGDIKHLSADGVPTLLMTIHQGTADHEYLIETGMMYVPLMNDDIVRAYRWRP